MQAINIDVSEVQEAEIGKLRAALQDEMAKRCRAEALIEILTSRLGAALDELNAGKQLEGSDEQAE